MVVGLAVILFGYLVPHLVQTRHQLGQSRVEDRFSGTLRIVATGATVRRSAPGEHHGTAGSRPYLHGPRRRTEAPAVNRPTTQSERAAAVARRLAAARAARAAEISRRRAAARRRLVLTLVLLAATTVGWLAFGLASVTVVAGVVPTLLLGTVLVLGRRAAKIAARRNAADRAVMTRLERDLADLSAAATRATDRRAGRTARSPRTRSHAPASTDAGSSAPQASGEGDAAQAADQGATPAAQEGPGPAETSNAEQATPAAPSVSETGPAADTDAEATTDVGATTDAGARAAAEAESDEPGGDSWTPVPVPAPSYTLKPPAPRRDIAPYEPPAAETPAGEQPAPKEPAEPRVVASGLAGSPYAPVADPEPVEGPVVEEPPARGMDLDSVLARRRAVGA